MGSDLVQSICQFVCYLEEQNEIDFEKCDVFLGMISENYYQIIYFPNDYRIEIIGNLLSLIAGLLLKLNNFAIHHLLNEDVGVNNFKKLVLILLNNLSVHDVTSLLYVTKKETTLTLKKRITKRELIHQDSIYSILALNKIIILMEPKITTNDMKNKLREMKFILDFVTSEDNKYLKLLKFGKSFFNLGSIFKGLRKTNVKGENAQDNSIFKKLFVILNSFDESKIPMQIELGGLTEDNLSFLIHNIFYENLRFEKPSFREDIVQNIFNDVAKLCNLYLLFFEKELDNLQNNLNDSLDQVSKKYIDSRLNILEVCIVLLNKKKEFPIFKLLSDILLAYFRSIYLEMNFIQIIKLLGILSKDQFLLFYDNTYFAQEIYPLIIIYLNTKKNLINPNNGKAIIEILFYMDKLNFFNFKNPNFFKQQKENIVSYDKFITYMRRILTNKEKNFDSKNEELDIIFFYLDILSHQIIESENSIVDGNYTKRSIINQVNYYLFENLNTNTIQRDLENLGNFLANTCSAMSKEKDFEWDKYMDQTIFFFNVKNMNWYINSLIVKGKCPDRLKIFSKNPLRIDFELDKNCSELSNKNYYEEYFSSNINKIYVKLYIYVLVKIIGIRKDIIEKELRGINNLELFNFIHSI